MQASEQERATRSLSSLIDAETFSAYQVLIIALCAVIAMLDGFDTQSIAFVAPTVANDIGVHVADFGPIFAAGLAGGLLGAMSFGFIADRSGRRVTLLATLLLFGLCSLLTITAASKSQFIMYRFLTGLGLGGAMPSIIAMTA
ncbi:MAG TPA: MFS transporter, partial [Steroidobacteraceae bacterium]